MNQKVKFADFTFEEERYVQHIADRVKELDEKFDVAHDRTSLIMDISAVHAWCPIDLRGLAEADDLDFVHDISGIRINLNRVTGKLENRFIPRYISCP